MANETPSYVQVSPDSTGKKVSAVQGQQVGSDGSQSVIETQMVAMADLDGNLTEVDTISLFNQLKGIHETLERMLDLMYEAFDVELRQSTTSKRMHAVSDTTLVRADHA